MIVVAPSLSRAWLGNPRSHLDRSQYVKAADRRCEFLAGCVRVTSEAVRQSGQHRGLAGGAGSQPVQAPVHSETLILLEGYAPRRAGCHGESGCVSFTRTVTRRRHRYRAAGTCVPGAADTANDRERQVGLGAGTAGDGLASPAYWPQRPANRHRPNEIELLVCGNPGLSDGAGITPETERLRRDQWGVAYGAPVQLVHATTVASACRCRCDKAHTGRVKTVSRKESVA